jgi:hypothetical protein
MKQNDSLPTPFDDYEISGVRAFGSGAERYCEPVPDTDAEFWSLYGHIPGEGVECIGDYKSRQAAEEMYARITGRRFSNLQPPDRCGRFSKVVFEYTDDDTRTSLIDLLADSLHWCESKSIDFEQALLVAREHFAAESTKVGRP